KRDHGTAGDAFDLLGLVPRVLVGRLEPAAPQRTVGAAHEVAQLAFAVDAGARIAVDVAFDQSALPAAGGVAPTLPQRAIALAHEIDQPVRDIDRDRRIAGHALVDALVVPDGAVGLTLPA